ncbi:hypothetical protein F511_26247 [Dorcoceras hygrometricum]|uniref:Uncharacterized protein n=1 Tax=Dorcoceras hygrometricum TaxID=472368 RepID=A0A2Z7APP2_9LAMI|nr:hypothetical protein F511_26247 [Dorcoceras hygrometricum]
MIQRVRDLGRFRAIDLLPKLRTKVSDFVLPDFTRKLEDKNEEQVEEEEQDQFWGW